MPGFEPLVEGEYNGILVPGKHYIELKRDFSNIEEVLDIVKKDELREEIVQNAWNDIVASGKYTYRVLVDDVINNSLGVNTKRSPLRVVDLFVYCLMEINDKLSSVAREYIMSSPMLIKIVIGIRDILFRRRNTKIIEI